jgi:hypothetical protein
MSLLLRRLSGQTVVNLFAVGKLAAKARASSTFVANVSAQTATMVFGKAASSGSVHIAAITASMLKGVIQATLNLALSAKGTDRSTGKAGPSGVVGIAARAMSAVFDKLSPPIQIAFLTGMATSMLRAAAQGTFKLALLAKGTDRSTGRAGSSGVVSLAARALSAVFGKSKTPALIIFLTAQSAIKSFGSGILSFPAFLQFISGLGAIMSAAAQASVSVFYTGSAGAKIIQRSPQQNVLTITPVITTLVIPPDQDTFVPVLTVVPIENTLVLPPSNSTITVPGGPVVQDDEGLKGVVS